MRRVRAAIGLLVLVVATASCGEGAPDAAPLPPKVPVELVPPSLQSGALRMAEDDKAREVFMDAGTQALAADGRVFAIRGAADRLVGTLQLTTLHTEVDLADPGNRDRITAGILSSRESLRVGAVEVFETRNADKVVYLWFGRDLFQVLQLKPTSAVTFSPENVLQELIAFQQAQPEWNPVPGQGPQADDTGDEEDEG